MDDRVADCTGWPTAPCCRTYRLADCTGWPTIPSGRKNNRIVIFWPPGTVGHVLQSASQYSRRPGTVDQLVQSAKRHSWLNGTVRKPLHNRKL
uniref:Uncharacterized protein n=1 Tax=Romanomermis culicivorax TaxID=13658 RepID=A0A915J6B0_ROMCU